MSTIWSRSTSLSAAGWSSAGKGDRMNAEAPALLKDILGAKALETIADAGSAASARFDRGAFLHAASDGLDALSIMERVRHIADALHPALRSEEHTSELPSLMRISSAVFCL